MSSIKVELTLEIAKNELKNVPWPMLRMALGIDSSIETKIVVECRGDEEGAMAWLLRHWFDNHDTSWEALSKALMSVPPFKRKGAYLYNKYVNPESFTAKKIVEELDFVQDWFELGHPFLDNSDRVRAAVANTPLENRRLRVIEAWFEYYDLPSWHEVANIVEECFHEEQDTAEVLRKVYLPYVEIMKPSQQKVETKLEELTPQSAFTLTRPITDWYALGKFLNIEEEELSAFERDNPRADSKRQAVLDHWLQFNKEASWMMLGKAVSKIRQNLGLSQRILGAAEQEKVHKTDDPFNEMNNESKIYNMKEYIGGIQAKVKRLSISQEDKNTIQSTMDDLKIKLEQLKLSFIQKEEQDNLLKNKEIAHWKKENEKIQEELQVDKKMMTKKDMEILRLKEGNEESEDTMKQLRKYSKQTEDASVQFDYWIPMKDLLYGAVIVDEIVFNVVGKKAQLFEWPECGFSLQVPEGALAGTEVCSVAIKALISGRFEFPKGFQLISALYAISPGRIFRENVKIIIQHCFLIERKNQMKRLCFIRANPTANPSNPYAFEKVKGGIFTKGSQNCELSLTDFSIYGAGVSSNGNDDDDGDGDGGDGGDGDSGDGDEEMLEHDDDMPVDEMEISEEDVTHDGDQELHLNSATQESTTEHLQLLVGYSKPPVSSAEGATNVLETKKRLEQTNKELDVVIRTKTTKSENHHVDALLYRAYLYYESTPIINNWNLAFMATDHLNTHITYVTNKYKNHEEANSFSFRFDESELSAHIQLLFTVTEDKKIPFGWGVWPSDSCSIIKDEIDALCTHNSENKDGELFASIPKRTVEVFAENNTTSPRLRYKAPVKGMSHPMDVYITRRLQTKGNDWTGAKNTLQCQEEEYEPLDLSDVEDKQLEEDSHLFEVLSAIQTVIKWEVLGLALGIKSSKLMEIKTDERGKTSRCREEMLRLWFHDCKATWKKLCQALDKDTVGERNLAKKIANEHKTSHKENVVSQPLEESGSNASEH